MTLPSSHADVHEPVRWFLFLRMCVIRCRLLGSQQSSLKAAPPAGVARLPGPSPLMHSRSCFNSCGRAAGLESHGYLFIYSPPFQCKSGSWLVLRMRQAALALVSARVRTRVLLHGVPKACTWRHRRCMHVCLCVCGRAWRSRLATPMASHDKSDGSCKASQIRRGP